MSAHPDSGQEKIKGAVRDAYGQVARRVRESDITSTCCAPQSSQARPGRDRCCPPVSEPTVGCGCACARRPAGWPRRRHGEGRPSPRSAARGNRAIRRPRGSLYTIRASVQPQQNAAPRGFPDSRAPRPISGDTRRIWRVPGKSQSGSSDFL